MEFDLSGIVISLIGAALPIFTGVLASMYISWRAKVTADGIKDWRDHVVNGIDDLVGKLEKDNGK